MISLFGARCKHERHELKTKWIEIDVKQNPPKPLVLEMIDTCADCGSYLNRSYPSRQTVEEHMKKKAEADGDTQRCWCFCNLRAEKDCACPCHF